MAALGQPMASAMGFGMAMTRGVSMNALASVGAMAGWPAVDSRWLRTAPQAEDAGDQITGRGPLVASSGQPSTSSDIPTPDDLRWTRTNAHRPLGLASSDELNVRARSVSSSTFSGDTAMSMAVQPLGTDWRSPPPGPPPEPSLVEQAPAVRAIATRRTTVLVEIVDLIGR